MANLNLSQFTEKTFVADADWTFVWDTAGAISKKVSRNNWLNSGTLTSDAPVTISQTWNAGGVAFMALKVNAVSTASAAGSLLLDLQVGTVSQVSVRKDGFMLISGVGIGVANIYTTGGGQCASTIASGLNVVSTLSLGSDTILLRDGAANTLALRNGTNAQTFNIYNTYQNAGVDYERIAFKWSANLFSIGREFGGTGGARNIRVIGGGSVVGIGEAASAAVDWTFASGTLLAGTDNSRDIGASGANRPRNVYVGTSLVVGASDGVTGSVTVGIGASKGIIFGNRGQIGAVGDGVFGFVDFAGTSFSRLQLGPNTDAAPAIARDGAGIKFTGAAAGSTAWVKVPPVAVSALPLAATAGVGARAFVNDATAPVFGSAVTGGGSVPVPVYSTGSAWNVG